MVFMINPLWNTIFGTFCDVRCELFAIKSRILDVVDYKQPIVCLWRELFAIKSRILDLVHYKQPIVCLWFLMANVENRPTATGAQFLPVNIHKKKDIYCFPCVWSFFSRKKSHLRCVMWAFCQNCHQWCVADASLIRHQRICWRSDMLALTQSLRLEERVNKVLFTCKTPLSSLTSCRYFCKFSISR